jgi:hypothetical protein
MVLPSVHERRVDPERDVVQESPASDPPDVDRALLAREPGQYADRVVPVEPQVPREVIARPVRNADERQPALHRDPSHARDRAVAPGRAQDIGIRRARMLRRVLSFAQDPRLDSACERPVPQLVRPRPAGAPGARVDQQQTPQFGRTL